ncbi:hypothetical protein RFI_21138, partial [Reticulomyxa filosa]
MPNEKLDNFISLEGISSDHIFKVESISPKDSIGVIEDLGFYFVVKERKHRTAWYISKDTKRFISNILLEKAEESVLANDAAKAQELLNGSLRYDESNVRALNLYGKLLCAAKLYEEALDIYGQCLSADPTNLEALTSRATIYYQNIKTPKYNEAEWHFKLAHKFHFDNVLLLGMYANFLSEMGKDKTLADKYYKKALETMETKSNEETSSTQKKKKKQSKLVLQVSSCTTETGSSLPLRADDNPNDNTAS